MLKRQGEAVEAHGFGPTGPLVDKVLRESIAATGEDVLAGRACLGAALLDRRVPSDLKPDEAPAEAIARIGLALDGEVLAIQGPPGTGKTTRAADLIRQLLDAGKRVGVTANSHAVIGNVLRAVGRPALQKCDENQHCGEAGVAWSPRRGACRGRADRGSGVAGRRHGVVLGPGRRRRLGRRARGRRGGSVLARQRSGGVAGGALARAAR